MAQALPEVFKRMQDKKKEQRELKAIYRDALSVNGEYQKIKEELEALKLQKKKIESGVQADFQEEFNKLEGLKLNIASDNQLLSDLALTQFTSGELVKIVDENQVAYEPIFTVRFKKV
jgi:predicted  nucleic acid-binding Zn-ribbon protein